MQFKFNLLRIISKTILIIISTTCALNTDVCLHHQNTETMNWLKIEGYKSNNNQAKSSGYNNLMWLKVNGNEHNNVQSASQNVEKSYSSVDVFFRPLFLL